MTHPFEPVPEESLAAVQPPAAETTAQEPATNEAPADAAMETELVPEERPAQETAIEEDYESQKTVEERRPELDEIRKSLISDIGPQALRLADARPSLIFDARHVFIGPNDKYQPEAIRCDVQDIEKFSSAAYDVQEEPLAVRCRLLALILADSPTAALEISGKEEINLMDMLYTLLLS